MSFLGGDAEEKRDDHPVAVFVLVAVVVFAILFLAAEALGGSESEPNLQASTPAGGGGSGEVATLPEQPAAPPSPELEAPAPDPVAEPVAMAAPAAPSAPAPAVSARSYAVLDRSCGALAYGFHERERMAPASLTKIVTALVVAKQGNLHDVVNVDVSGSKMRSQGSSVMGIEPGMRFSVLDLLYGLMLPSGNDAALALASHLGGGNVDAFVEMMNAEAQALGMHDTQFSNPHGLDSRELYSSAYDMALAGRATLDIPLLWEVGNTRSWTTESGLAFRNGNKLLSSYPGVYGVKIGYTNAAKQTIVIAAERDGREVVLSVLGSDDRYADSQALLDWAFEHVPPAC